PQATFLLARQQLGAARRRETHARGFEPFVRLSRRRERDLGVFTRFVDRRGCDGRCRRRTGAPRGDTAEAAAVGGNDDEVLVRADDVERAFPVVGQDRTTEQAAEQQFEFGTRRPHAVEQRATAVRSGHDRTSVAARDEQQRLHVALLRAFYRVTYCSAT